MSKGYGVIIALFTVLSWQSLAYAEQQSIGQVLLTQGKVEAKQADNTVRVLKRGAAFFAQDTIITADKAQAQIRFSDGTLVAIRPNSAFKISEYQYTATTDKQKIDKNSLKYTTQLIQGGLRTVTGAIAKEDPDDYKINTTVATIGVRGTEFSIVLNKICETKPEKCDLSAAMYSGRIYLENSKGILEIGENTNFKYAYISSAIIAPKGLTTKPAVFENDISIIPTPTTSTGAISTTAGPIFQPKSPQAGICLQ